LSSVTIQSIGVVRSRSWVCAFLRMLERNGPLSLGCRQSRDAFSLSETKAWSRQSPTDFFRQAMQPLQLAANWQPVHVVCCGA
jgi:hypothetical protein